MASTNLAPERSTFFGRERETGELARALAEGARLVTLTGPPGVGKSRLARQVALASKAVFPGGVWACDLARADGTEELGARVGEALGVAPGGPPLVEALAARGRALLVLDDADRVVPA